MKKLLRSFGAVVLMAFLAVSMSACGGGDDNNWFWFPTTPPDAPTGVVAIFNNSSSATVSWNAVADATSYNVYYAEASGVSKTVHDVMVSTGGTSYTFEGAEQLAVDTTYYFVVTAVKDSKESVESLEVSAKYTTFSQADLEGAWYITVFRTGNVPAGDLAWLRMRVDLDAEGVATFLTYEESGGNDTLPGGLLTYTIDANGNVTQGGIYSGNTSHNVMSSDKTLIIGTYEKSETVKEIRIMQKANDSGFSDLDLANKSFAFHQLSSGAEKAWVRGEGSIDDVLAVTITSITDSSGGGTVPDIDTLIIAPDGTVTSVNDPYFEGVMSLDKTLIVGTTKNADETSFQLRITQTSGGTFTMGDLAGAYKFSALYDGTSALWQYGTLTIDSSGTTNFLTYLDSNAVSDLPPSIVLTMNAAGTITSAADAMMHGTLSYNKDLMVSTSTVDPGGSELYGLSLAVK